jgi:peptide/nickel transport system permease protein
MPGDPAQIMMLKMSQGSIQPDTYQKIRDMLGLSNAPLPVQYFQYLNNLLHGNLGISYSNFPSPIGPLVAEHIQWTFGLVGFASVLSFILGTLLGIIVAWKRGSALDSILPVTLSFLSSIPYFWLGLGLLYFLAFLWFPKVFPIGSGYDIFHTVPGWTTDFIFSVIQHGILPALTIVLGSIAGWLLTMRNTMVTTLSEDYVLMAEAKGLSQNRVMLMYAARNAILPSITGFAMSLGFVVGGSLVTEIVFNYPGIGFLLFTAVQGIDYPLIEFIFLVIALAVLGANFLADIVYTFLDPRVRQERG